MSNRAWVTLATNDSYGLGALVLAHSLRRVSSAYPAVVLITPSVTEAMRERLRAVFAEVITVDVLDSRDAAHLALLKRPELGITFTKIHCWNLTQYEKCVFLDADTLVVQNSDELFEREELSAAPDVGWPDCFNSGVFVFIPSAETFSRLIAFAQERGSFDGGDQGLLNSFFSDWARGDINKHLPFLYNVTSAAFYSYLPALKHYGQDLKIIHFIGAAKPWLQHFNFESRTVDAPDHIQGLLQLWWDIFVSQIHTQLDTSMSGVAGNLARVVPGAASYEALDDLTRRQGWEAGNIDYMGADSFEKIWAKISQTLSAPRVSPPKQPSPPKEPSPPVPEEVKVQEAEVVKETVSEAVEVAKEAVSEKASVPPSPTVTPATPVVEEPAVPKKAPVETAPVKTGPIEAAPVSSVTVPDVASFVTTASIIDPEIAELPPLPTSVEEVIVNDVPAPVSSVPVPDVAPVVIEASIVSPTIEGPPMPASIDVPVSDAPAPASEVPAAKVQVLIPGVPATDILGPTPAEEPVTDAPAPVSVKAQAPEVPAPTSIKAPAPKAPVPVEASSAKAPAPVPVADPIEVPVTVAASESAPEQKTEEAKEATVKASKVSEASATPSKKASAKADAPATDSPPLANTPSKEEASVVPAAKSEERRKPVGKLSLAPPSAAEALPTPDSEAEDAATLATAIIASELTPVESPALPPAPASAPLPKGLTVAEPEVPMPPVGAVSLAQIGVKPKETIAARIESSVAAAASEAPSDPPKADPPKADPPKKKLVKKVVKKDKDAAATGAEAPVPPPRKKEKKPKEK